MQMQELVDEFEHTAAILAEADLDEESWLRLRRRVVHLIERGSFLTTSGDLASAHWDQTDPPVLLARAFGTIHTRLVAALDQSAATAGQPAAA